MASKTKINEKRSAELEYVPHDTSKINSKNLHFSLFLLKCILGAVAIIIAHLGVFLALILYLS